MPRCIYPVAATDFKVDCQPDVNRRWESRRYSLPEDSSSPSAPLTDNWRSGNHS